MAFGPVWLMQPIPYFGEKITGDWIYEPKIDGWRMQIVHYPHDIVECWGRRLERTPNWSQKLQTIVRLAKKSIPAGTIIDCELFSSGGRRFIPSLFAQKPKVKPIIYVFDVVYFKGKNMSKLPLEDRKEILYTLNLKSPFFNLIGKQVTEVKNNYAEEVKKGSEGIVIKKMDSPYLVGKEAPIATHYWRKIK
jgi:ATP-dependent DNA ligase